MTRRSQLPEPRRAEQTAAVTLGAHLPRVRQHALRRGPWCATLLVAATLISLTRGGGAADVPGLAQILSQHTLAEVPPDSIAWEPSRGFWTDLLAGRRVLFLAGEPTAPKDVYRAWLRIAPDGKPVGVRKLVNITDTSLGDDVGLRIEGHTAMFATLAYGRIQAVSLLDVRGIPEANQPDSLVDRLLLAVNSYQRTGSVHGLGRTDIVFDVPIKGAELELSDKQLVVEVGAAERSLRYDLTRAELTSLSGGRPYAARAEPQRYRHKPLILWAVDTVRTEVGPAPIAWLEDRVFSLRDALKRTTLSLVSSDQATYQLTLDGPNTKASAAEAEGAQDEAEGIWPPAPLESQWQESEPGEGEWEAVELAWLKRLQAPDGSLAPPYFYRSFVRPDPNRPYVKLTLIAMDMRQLELRMEAGYEDPKPLTGPSGTGRLPNEPDLLGRVVATFNGAFKTTHGEYGMMVRRRVLLPPMPGGATVVTTDSGTTGLGNWPTTEDIPPDVVSFRQNLDPLVEDGQANPTGRRIWGWQLAGESVLTERTALCLTHTDQLIYAWGQELTGHTLAKGLVRAGCRYAIHLDMNPKHCGFVFTAIENRAENRIQVERVSRDMNINPAKFVLWSPKDFFYMTLREPRLTLGDAKWSVASGQQPTPGWLPGLFSTSVELGAIRVTVSAIAQGRVGFALRSGTREPKALAGAPMRFELSEDEGTALAAIGLGHATNAARMGLAFWGKAAIELRGAYATLVIDGQQQIRITGEIPDLDAESDAVQLPALAIDGKLTPSAIERGERRPRTALCVAPSGEVLLAEASHDSADPIAHALLKLGCSDIVELDRGSHHPARVDRAGSDSPPFSTYETSTLYVLDKPMRPSAFLWSPDGSSKATRPTGFDRGTYAR